MFFRSSKTILYSLLIVAFLLPTIRGFAQENLEEICQWKKIEEKPENLSDKDYENLLKKCQLYYEEKSREIEGDITRTQEEKNTLQNKIYILENKIKSLDYQIYQGNIMVKDLGAQIQDTQLSIDETNLKIEEVKRNLSNILQLQYEEDQRSFMSILLAEETLTGLFDELMALEAINLKTQDLLRNIKDLKFNLEGQKESMDEEKGNLERVVQIQHSQKQQSQAARSEQEYLLGLTEAQYQQYLKDKEAAEKMAAEIRARIFQLIGIPDIEAPSFGEALQIAEAVTRVVKIRPAFLLGVISAESALGRNVGQCYVTNSQTGGGVFIKSGNPINRIIHPTRDLPIFLRITGDNFSRIPVSCWILICQSTATGKFAYSPNVSVDKTGNIICPTGYVPWGFGGAMGPAQFIPSTWEKYEEKIISLFRVSNPNPWNVYDSFAASALYLYELGAGQRTLAAERNAAHRYSGGYSWYASDVMQRASCIQEFIDKSTMSSACERLIF